MGNSTNDTEAPKTRTRGPRKGRKRGAGGKLFRSETVSVRLEPKLRYLAELGARKQRRTLSSFIEWAVEESFSRALLHNGTGQENNTDMTIQQAAPYLWDVDEGERFLRLAILYPQLLDYEEQEIWKLLNDSCLLLPAKIPPSDWDWPILNDKVFPAVRNAYPKLKESYQIGPAKAREWVETTKKWVKENKDYLPPAPPPQLAPLKTTLTPKPVAPKVPEPELDDSIPF